MTTDPHHHLEGRFELYDAATIGSDNAIESGSDLLHHVNGNRLRVARHVYPDLVQLSPGHATHAHLTFERPEGVAQSFWDGREIEVYSDEKVIGKLTVTRVVSPALLGSPETVRRTMPASAQRPRIAALCAETAVYLLFAVPTLLLAREAYEPCADNFEGGCSMGRGLLAFASLLPAACAAPLGWRLRRVFATHPATERYAMAVGVLLGGAPLCYLLYTLKALFLG